MAYTDSQIISITEDLYLPKLADNIFNRTLMLSLLKKGEQTYSGGPKVRVPVEMDEALSKGWYSGWDILDTSVQDFITNAEFEWRQAYAVFGWSRRDELINMGSAQQVVSLISASTKNAEKSMRKQLTTAIFGSGGSSDIDGLGQLLAVGTTAWGTLTSTNFATWAPQRDTTTAKISLTALNQLEVAANDGDDQVNAHVTTDAIYGYYYDIATPLQRLGSEEAAKLGFKTLTFNGNPVWADKACTTNYWHGLNLDHVWLASHSSENMRYEKPMSPINQNASIGKVHWMGNLVGDSRRRHFVATAFTS